MESGIVAVAVKGLWAAGKVGREPVPGYRRVLAESACILRLADATLALTVLGLRHARLRAGVYKALSAPRADVDRSEDTRALAAALPSLGRAAIDAPARGLSIHRAYGARDLPAGSPSRFARPEDVPEDLAFTAGASLYQGFRADTRHLFGMSSLLPWLARARDADLYLPADFLRATRAPWRPADTIAMLQGHCATPPAPKAA